MKVRTIILTSLGVAAFGGGAYYLYSQLKDNTPSKPSPAPQLQPKATPFVPQGDVTPVPTPVPQVKPTPVAPVPVQKVAFPAQGIVSTHDEGTAGWLQAWDKPNGTLLGSFPKGAKVTVLGPASGGFIQVDGIDNNGVRIHGFVHSSFITIT